MDSDDIARARKTIVRSMELAQRLSRVDTDKMVACLQAFDILAETAHLSTCRAQALEDLVWGTSRAWLDYCYTLNHSKTV